jgi:hypothetical protein
MKDALVKHTFALKNAAFWDVMPCSLVDVSQHFEVPVATFCSEVGSNTFL